MRSVQQTGHALHVPNHTACGTLVACSFNSVPPSNNDRGPLYAEYAVAEFHQSNHRWSPFN